MLAKLTKRNEAEFFGAEPYPDLAFVGYGCMFTAAKHYEYTQLQELAVMGDIAIRRVNVEDMLKLKEDDFPLYKYVIENHWEVDAQRLFTVITLKEHKEMIMAYQRKLRFQGE